MRVFVAVDLPDEVKKALEDDVVGRLRPAIPGARWTRLESRHITLKFLGEVPEDRVPSVEEAVARAVAGSGAFCAAFRDVGGFPSLRRPRVVWVGLGEGAEDMARLAGRVHAALEPLGFVPERRPFRAHLTLARVNEPRPVADLPQVLVPAGAFEVAEVVLFRSQLRPGGAVYTAVRGFGL